MINIIIIESKLQDLERCGKLIKSIVPEAIVHYSQCSEDAFPIINNVNMDAIIIDMNLPDISGFKLADKIKKIKQYKIIPMIFTAESDVVSSMPHNSPKHYGLIIKPYTDDTFYEKIGELLIGIKENTDRIIAESKDIGQSRKILVNVNGLDHIIMISDILFAEVRDHSVNLYTKKSTIFEIRMSLSKLIELVNDKMFTQCHKSYAANMNNLYRVRKSSTKTWNIYFGNDYPQSCPLSISYYKTVQNMLQHNLDL
jgi:DNA-binding LytR/AlgR family response regulator